MNKTKEKLERNIWKFYLFQIFLGASFFLPIIVLFWQANALNFTEIMLLQSIFAIVVVALEVPTGYFADIFGRKESLILGAAFQTLGFVIYGVGTTFYGFLVAEIMLAIAVSLLSGANSAFVYDTLIQLKQEKRYKKIWGNSIFYQVSFVAVAAILGGFIATISYRLTLWVSAAVVSISIPLALSFYEPKRKKLIFKSGYTHEMFRLFKLILKNKHLRWLMIYSAVIFAFNQASLWLYQPYFEITGLNVAFFGFVFASFHIFSGLSSKYADTIENILGPKSSLITLVLLTAISYFLMSNFIFLFSFSFVFLQQFVRGFIKPILTDYVNKQTSSDIRATVLSVQNLFQKLVYALMIPFVGLAADVFNVIQVFTILGVMTLVVGLTVVAMMWKNKVI